MKTLPTIGAFICALLLAEVVSAFAQPQSEPTNNVSAQNAKAYKTLNFGDSAATTERKLPEVVENGEVQTDIDNVFRRETLWRSLFDSDAEYEPYKYDPSRSTQSEKLESLMRYFRETVGGEVLYCNNTAIAVNCYQLGMGLNTTTPEEHGGLAIVEVVYRTFDLDKLIEGFTQNFPNARKDKKSYKIESTVYPGVFLEFERTLFLDANSDRKATLSIPTEKFSFAFTEPVKLSKEKLAVWEGLMAQDGKTSQIKEFFESVKASLLELAKNIEIQKATRLRLDPLTYLGWYDNRQYEAIIYGGPKAVFASKQILGLHMNNYRQTLEAKDQAEKAKKEKESKASTGF